MRGEIIAVGAQPGNFRRLDVGTVRPAGEFVPNPGKIVITPPGGQPRTDVASTRNGRQELKSPEQGVLRLCGMFLIIAKRPSRHVESRQRLDYAQTESSAADAAPRKAKRRPIELVQRTVKALAALDVVGALALGAAGVCVLANALAFVALLGRSFPQTFGAGVRFSAAERDDLLGQRLLDGQRVHAQSPLVRWRRRPPGRIACLPAGTQPTLALFERFGQ